MTLERLLAVKHGTRELPQQQRSLKHDDLRNMNEPATESSPNPTAKLALVGLGLASEEGLTLQGLGAIRQAEKVYIETYTSHLPSLSLENLKALAGKPVILLEREDLEGDGLVEFIRQISDADKSAALLTPGDPLVATTHLAVRLEALRLGIAVQIIHAPSIISAAPGLAGLFSYKFGPTATITFQEPPPEAPYDILTENVRRGLHTLFLLDIQRTKRQTRILTIPQAVEQLQRLEKAKNGKTIASDTLVVGIAGAGAPQPEIKCSTIEEMAEEKFQLSPQTLILPGKLHFMEVEALQTIASAPPRLFQRQNV